MTLEVEFDEGLAADDYIILSRFNYSHYVSLNVDVTDVDENIRITNSFYNKLFPSTGVNFTGKQTIEIIIQSNRDYEFKINSVTQDSGTLSDSNIWLNTFSVDNGTGLSKFKGKLHRVAGSLGGVDQFDIKPIVTGGSSFIYDSVAQQQIPLEGSGTVITEI